MTDLRQAAQQALEALEGWEHCDKWVWPVSALEQSKRNTTESLAALRAALEQQDEPTCPDCKAAVLYECVACSSNNYPPKQQAEPVAWTTMPEAEDWCFVSGSKDPTGKLEGKWFPLYTTPPQRPWVGLTVTTILNMMPSAIPAEYDGPLMQFARDLEAKLKERNGY